MLNDHSILTGKFQEFEEKILKLLENKQNIDKEIEKIKFENENELNKLKETESFMQIELNKVSFEKSKNEKIIKELKKKTYDSQTNFEMTKMVSELYSSIILENQSDAKYYRKQYIKKDEESVREITDYLKVKFFFNLNKNNRK